MNDQGTILSEEDQFCQEESDPDLFDPDAEDPDGFNPPLLDHDLPVEDYLTRYSTGHIDLARPEAQQGVHNADASTARLSGLFRAF